MEIRAAHQGTRKTYGSERLKEDLAENGVNTRVHSIKRIRRKLGIRCKQNASLRQRQAMPVASSLLGQKFKATAPNQTWVTYIPTDEGWLYLAAGHKDLFTGDLVGYAMSERMTRNWVSQSLFRGMAAKRPPRGLIHHSDRGSHYYAHEYGKLLDQFGMVPSMSRRGNCYGNAPWKASGDCSK
ncbi:hypothetical protein NTG1052_370022 [Candidatus Nitrotoga sp. 1052]|nr:hypothetical protein NTG1052_370022 [Candidatus Nitrotoga sp. 1052]